MKKTIASVLLFLIAWFSWPLWTALQIREAVISGDTPCSNARSTGAACAQA